MRFLLLPLKALAFVAFMYACGGFLVLGGAF